MTKSNFTLYDLTDKMQGLLDYATNAATEEDLQAFYDTYESLDMVMQDKFDGCAAVLAELEAREQALKEEAAKFSARAKTIHNNIDNLKGYMLANMRKIGETKIDTGKHRISIAKNGGQQKMNILVPLEDIPEQFKIVEEKPNIKEIRKHIQKVVLEDGTEAYEFQPYDKVIARLEPRGEHLKVGV